MPLALQYIGLAVGLSIAAILCIAWQILRGPKLSRNYCGIQRGKRFRLLHLRFEAGQWCYIQTPMGGHDTWYWDKPLLPWS